MLASWTLLHRQSNHPQGRQHHSRRYTRSAESQVCFPLPLLVLVLVLVLLLLPLILLLHAIILFCWNEVDEAAHCSTSEVTVFFVVARLRR